MEIFNAEKVCQRKFKMFIILCMKMVSVYLQNPFVCNAKHSSELECEKHSISLINIERLINI